MISSISLKNFKSFGASQRVPLSPISVLVGPNNSGKSSFISVGAFASMLAKMTYRDALNRIGGTANLIHRPRSADGRVSIGWSSDAGSYLTSLRIGGEQHVPEGEDLVHVSHGPAFRDVTANVDGRNEARRMFLKHELDRGPFAGFTEALRTKDPQMARFAEVLTPLAHSREVKLSVDVLRRDANFQESPVLGSDGSDLAAVLALWRGADPERCEELDATLHASIPEIARALVKPTSPSSLRIWFQQADGEQFDASHVSDGVLLFTALIMHALDAEPGSIIFLEEPEHSIHPRRLHDVVELLRRIVERNGCQFVIATHSPVLLNEFRDEPEAVLLFRRGVEGTIVTSLAEVPSLVQALQKSEPGELLANGFFNDPL